MLHFLFFLYKTIVFIYEKQLINISLFLSSYFPGFPNELTITLNKYKIHLVSIFRDLSL